MNFLPRVVHHAARVALQPLRYLHSCSGCFRLERLPGGTCTHWKAPPFHGARQQQTSDPDRTLSPRGGQACGWLPLTSEALAALKAASFSCDCKYAELVNLIASSMS